MTLNIEDMKRELENLKRNYRNELETLSERTEQTKRNLKAYLFQSLRTGFRFMVVAANIDDAFDNAQMASRSARYCGLSCSLPGVTQHVLASNGVNQ